MKQYYHNINSIVVYRTNSWQNGCFILLLVIYISTVSRDAIEQLSWKSGICKSTEQLMCILVTIFTHCCHAKSIRLNHESIMIYRCFSKIFRSKKFSNITITPIHYTAQVIRVASSTFSTLVAQFHYYKIAVC